MIEALILLLAGPTGARQPPEGPPGEPPAEPAAETAPEAPGEPPDEEEAQTPAERRQQRRKAMFEGPIPKPEADFIRGDTEIKLRLAFNGYTPGPFSLFTSFTGWNEVSLTLDQGSFSWRGFTIGLGATAFYDQAFLLGALTQPVANYDDWHFRWQMWEAGGTLRTTFHWTGLRGVDPYLFVGVGAGLFHIQARVEGWPLTTAQVVERPYLRFEGGGGLTWPIGRTRFVAGVELRYLVSTQFKGVRQLDLRYAGDTATFLLFPQHKPPKGFGWIAHVGVRF